MALNFAITVHGEFETMRQVLAFISTLVNSSAYKGGITAFFILSLTLTMATGSFDLLFGDQRRLTTWVKLFFIAVFLYAAFLSGSATVVLYDDVTGRSQTQGNIPPGIAAMMAVPNWVATEFEDLVKSYLAPSLPLSPFAYEYGVKMIGESYTGEMASALANIIDPQMWESASNYVQDCVALRAARESSYAKKLYSGDNPYQAWSEAINYFFYTYTSLDANGNPLPEGTPDESVTCAEAWNRLDKYFNSTRWQDVVNEFCTLMHFGTDTTSISACRDIMSTVFSRYVMGGLTVSPENIARNVFAGKVFYAYLSSLDPSVSSARIASFARAQAELSGKGIVAQEWLPIMKTVFYILACALIPLALLFIGTGTGPVKFLAGLFLWWAVWCGIDAVIYSLWISRADGIFQVVRDGARLGLHGLEDLWFLSSKAFAILGGMRTFGFMLAGTFVYTVFRFGGSVMAHLASGIVGTVSSGTSEASGYVSADNKAWAKNYEVLGRYAREAAAVRQTGSLAFFERSAAVEAAQTASKIKGFEGFKSAVGPNALELLARARTGGLLQSTARGLAAANVPLSALAGYYGIELGKNVLTASEITKQARQAGFSSVGDYLSAVAEGKAGAQVADAVRWEQMKKFFPGTSPTDLAGWLSGKMTPSWGIERKLSEWTGLSTGVFSDLKVKDFAWNTEKGTPSLLTLGGTLDRQALLRLADELDARGLDDTADGLRRIANEYGSADVALTLGPDGKLAHLNVNAGSEARSYDLYHDKDLTNLENYRTGNMALSAKTAEGREILQELRSQALKHRWYNAVKFLDDLLSHPEKAAYLRWTTDENGNLSTLEMKEGSQWKRLDTGLSDTSTKVRGDYTTVEDTVDAGTLEGYRKLEKLIDDAQKNPKLKNVVNKLGEALVWGDSFKYRAVYDRSGNLTNIQVEQGGKFIDLDKVDMDHTAHGKYYVPVKDKDGKEHYELVEGNLVYNEGLGQWEVVAGNVAYGLQGRVIRYLPPDPRTGRPGGLVFADVRWDPGTGKIVSGKESSVLVKEGEIEVAGLKMHGYEAYDTRTGTRLFRDAKTGNFYTYTPYGEHWKELRGVQGQGSYFLSALHEGVKIIGGEKAARLVTQVAADTAKGLDETVRAIGAIQEISTLRKTKTRDYTTPEKLTEKESPVLGPDGKLASSYTGFKTAPRERIHY